METVRLDADTSQDSVSPGRSNNKKEIFGGKADTSQDSVSPGGATMRRKSLMGRLHDCLRNRDSGGNQEETMGDGLDSLVRGETQVIKMARGYFWNKIVLYFINLHFNSD